MDKTEMAHIVGETFGHEQCPEEWADDIDYLVQSLGAIPEGGYNYVTVSHFGGVGTILGSRGLSIHQRGHMDGYYEFSLPVMEGNSGPARTEHLRRVLAEWAEENTVYQDLLDYMSTRVATWVYS